MSAGLTIADIADTLHTKTHRINYAIRRIGIKPTQWVGHTRLFTERQAREIADYLDSDGRKKA